MLKCGLQWKHWNGLWFISFRMIYIKLLETRHALKIQYVTIETKWQCKWNIFFRPGTQQWQRRLADLGDPVLLKRVHVIGTLPLSTSSYLTTQLDQGKSSWMLFDFGAYRNPTLPDSAGSLVKRETPVNILRYEFKDINMELITLVKNWVKSTINCANLHKNCVHRLYQMNLNCKCDWMQVAITPCMEF